MSDLKMRSNIVMIGILCGAVGCATSHATAPRICTAVEIPAIKLTVRDSITGAAAAANAVLVARQWEGTPSGVDSGYMTDSLTMLVGEMPATYDLTLTKPGYSDWIATGLSVASADPQGCHPVTLSVQALLQPTR